MAEITNNKRGYPKNGSTRRSLEEINESLKRRGRPTVTQTDLDIMHAPRSKARKVKASIFVLKKGEKLAVRVGRDEGDALIKDGKATSVKRQDLKSGKVLTKDAAHAGKTSNNAKKKAKRGK